MQHEEKFILKSNLKENFQKFGANQFVKHQLRGIIDLQRRAHSHQEDAEDKTQDLAALAFSKLSLAQGVDMYKQMFAELSELPQCKKYKKQIAALVKWLSYAGKTDRLLEIICDEGLIETAEKDPAVMSYLIAKYEKIDLD